ncbi:hypothetical protein ABC347_01575 [Sphingomonas sp. 1P06PA]|uniref:hypothetical protein n=1 Tax=Sphingomonas sp. 1P06PA TaxID=554121 RepID=UPI0039A76979
MSRALILALLVASTPALAEPPTKPAAQDGAAAEKVICRRIYETGSLVKSKKICRTSAQWKAESVAARDAASQFQNAPASSGSN